MATVRNEFHELGNWHNKISLAAINTKNALKNQKQNIAKLGDKDLIKLVNRAIRDFKRIEQFVINAEDTISAFKPYVYSNLNPDVEMSSGKQRRKKS